MKTEDYFVDTPGGGLSGRISGPESRPRELVAAIHGGTYDAGYYDMGPDSLLSLGAALDLCVLALDRPGYGAARALDPRWLSFDGQTRLLAAALDQAVGDIDPLGGVVLVGHSIGGMLALRVAAQAKHALRGVEVSGIGLQWRPGMQELWSSFVGDQAAIDVPPQAHAHVMFGPPGTNSEDRKVLDAELLRPMPMPELMDVIRWADAFPSVARDVTAPVSITFPENDNIWMTDADARARAAALFTHAASVRAELLPQAGHCIELHKQARSYCLRQLAFAEECLSY